jgi:subtilisin family serine protease
VERHDGQLERDRGSDRHGCRLVASRPRLSDLDQPRGELQRLPQRRLDNDHNGFVDDWHGWDFANTTTTRQTTTRTGQHVAGTIGAAGNNGVGVAGVNWNVKIMPVKFLNAQGSGTVRERGQRRALRGAERAPTS